MVPDWQTNGVYVSHLLPKRHVELWESLKAVLAANGVTVRQVRGAKDLWVRDFMPIQSGLDRFVKFRYEPDYLKGHEHLITGEKVCRSLPLLRECVRSSINLDGGNVIAANHKVILTEKVFKENPEVRRPALRKELLQLFQVEDCIIIPKEPIDPIGHADGIVRFIDEGTVLINDYSMIDKDYGRRLRAVLKKHRLLCVEVPYFVEGTAPEGVPSALGCWINYLRTESLIVVPAFGLKQDGDACKKLESVFPLATVVQLRCEDLARKGGVLNCCTWSIRTNSKTPSQP